MVSERIGVPCLIHWDFPRLPTCRNLDMGNEHHLCDDDTKYFGPSWFTSGRIIFSSLALILTQPYHNKIHNICICLLNRESHKLFFKNLSEQFLFHVLRINWWLYLVYQIWKKHENIREGLFVKSSKYNIWLVCISAVHLGNWMRLIVDWWSSCTYVTAYLYRSSD